MSIKCLLSFLFLVWSFANGTETPIIGILSQEAYLVNKAYPDADSFIVASYVKLLESSGARVLPIWIGQDQDYYKRVVNFTNGILFPGGGTYFNETGGYGAAARELYRYAIELNNNGIVYPLWGICLGMQVLLYAQLGIDIRRECQARDVSLPLQFEPDYETSRLFANAPDNVLTSLQTKNITYNFHKYCLLREDLKVNDILQYWQIISTNVDQDNTEFISTMEHLHYPFYGTQYHPEKNSFEFKKSSAIPHSIEAIESGQYFGNFFINEARKNNNSFSDEDIETTSLIYNYIPVYSARNTSYEQLYLFKKSDYNNLL